MNDDEKVDNMYSLLRKTFQKDFSAHNFAPNRGTEEVLKNLREQHLFNEQQVECVKLLLEWRKRFTKGKKMQLSHVMKIQTMIVIAKCMPQKPNDLNRCFNGRPIAWNHKVDLLRCVTLAIQRHPNIKPTTSGLMQHGKEFKSFDEQQGISF